MSETPRFKTRQRPSIASYPGGDSSEIAEERRGQVDTCRKSLNRFGRGIDESKKLRAETKLGRGIAAKMTGEDDEEE